MEPKVPLKKYSWTLLSLQQTIEKWRNVFLLSALISLMGCVAFLAFGRASVQDFNTYWEKKKLKGDEIDPRSKSNDGKDDAAFA